MSIKQITQIKSKDKENIMKSIFDNYIDILNLKQQNKVNINEKGYRKIKLFALTDSIINLMDKEETKIIKNKYLLKKNAYSNPRLSSAVDKFVYYLLV